MTDILQKLYIEPTSRCNLNCTMCFRKTWIGETFGDMTRSVFDNAMETMPESVGTVFFGGMGEPLFHEDILYMISAAAARSKKVGLLTNGTMLTQPTASALLDAGLSELWVSVDSFEPDGYENIRQNSNFTLIRKNIAGFNIERSGREDCAVRLGLAFVAMKSNAGQLRELARFAAENQVNDVNISNVMPTDEASYQNGLYNRIISLELLAQDGGGGRPSINLPMMDFRLPEVKDGLVGLMNADANLKLSGSSLMRRRKYCRFVEEGNAFVRFDGDVSPCMALLHSAATYLDGSRRVVYHHAFGNVKNEGLDDIWRNTEYTDFRRRVRGFEFSPCLSCGGCDNRDDNKADCLGNQLPTCGACLWSEGILSCP